jgi:hypothetical protein
VGVLDQPLSPDSQKLDLWIVFRACLSGQILCSIKRKKNRTVFQNLFCQSNFFIWSPLGALHFLKIWIISYEVLTNSVFWDITPRSPLKVNRGFGGTRCLQLQGRRISQAEQLCLPSAFHSSFLLGLFFDSEDGSDMLFRNVSWLLTDYTGLYPRI